MKEKVERQVGEVCQVKVKARQGKCTCVWCVAGKNYVREHPEQKGTWGKVVVGRYVVGKGV